METRKVRTPSAKLLAAKQDEVFEKVIPTAQLTPKSTISAQMAKVPESTTPEPLSVDQERDMTPGEHELQVHQKHHQSPILEEEIDVSNTEIDASVLDDHMDTQTMEIEMEMALKREKIDAQMVLNSDFSVANEVTISSMKYQGRPTPTRKRVAAATSFTGETLNLKSSDLSIPNKAAHFLYFRCYEEHEVQKEFPLTIDETRKGPQNFLVEPRHGLKNTDYYIDSYLWNRGKSTSSKKKIFVEIEGNHVKTSRRTAETAHYVLNWYYSNMENRICKKVLMPQSSEIPQIPEKARNLTKRELKTLKNALGKQGLTMEQHENAQKSTKPCEILQIDTFSIDNSNLEDGWYVGYGVEYNGVGISAAGGAPDSSASSESGDLPPAENREAGGGESSGFDSDPPTDDDDDEAPQELLERRESDDISDKGQLLYGLDSEFYVDKALKPTNVEFHDKNDTKSFKTGEFVTTQRFGVATTTTKCSETDDEFPQGYQIIGDGNVPCATTSEDEDDVITTDNFDDVTTSSGLWCNFVISPDDFVRKNDVEKLEISEEKSMTIPLDGDKLAQISAAMANFQLPTPPGWEGVSDSKILEFVRQRV